MSIYLLNPVARFATLIIGIMIIFCIFLTPYLIFYFKYRADEEKIQYFKIAFWTYIICFIAILFITFYGGNEPRGY